MITGRDLMRDKGHDGKESPEMVSQAFKISFGIIVENVENRRGMFIRTVQMERHKVMIRLHRTDRIIYIQ